MRVYIAGERSLRELWPPLGAPRHEVPAGNPRGKAWVEAAVLMPDAPPPIPRTGAGAQARRPLPARNAGEPEPEPAPEMAGDPATIVVAHTARKIPRRQLSVRRGEAVTVVEQSLDGWWEIQTAEGALGIVPALKVQIQAAGDKGREHLGQSLRRTRTRASLSLAHIPRPGAEKEGWRKNRGAIKGAAQRAGYGGDAPPEGEPPPDGAAPEDVQLEPAEEVPSCLSQAANVAGMELQRVAYSVWSKQMTFFVGVFMVMHSVTILVMEKAEEDHLNQAHHNTFQGEVTSYHQIGALASLLVSVIVCVNERFWEAIPCRKGEKEGTLVVRVLLLLILLVLQLVATPVWLGFCAVLLALLLTVCAMRHGESDRPWETARAAAKLEREEREALGEIYQREGAREVLKEELYRVMEEDKLGRYVVLALYYIINCYLYASDLCAKLLCAVCKTLVRAGSSRRSAAGTGSWTTCWPTPPCPTRTS